LFKNKYFLWDSSLLGRNSDADRKVEFHSFSRRCNRVFDCKS